MKTLLIALMVGVAAAVVQPRAPVYQPSVTVTSTGSTTSVSSTPPKALAALGTTPMTPAPVPTPSLPVSPQPVAQARESVAADASMMQGTAVNPSTPSQNYYVYYYPHNGQATATSTVVGQPNSSSLWTWNGWGDVAAGVGSLALVAVGGGILYNQYGSKVKARALRELKDLTTDDAARMARGVLRALEKFSAINTHTE